MRYDKVNKYIRDYLAAFNSVLESNKYYKDSDGECILIDPKVFKDILKEICTGNVDNELKVYRDLNFIIAEKNRFTTRRKIKGRTQRFIATKIATIRRLRDLIN